jgi:hypothetical protein
VAAVSDYTTLASALQEYLYTAALAVPGRNLDYLISEVEQEMNARLRVRRMLTSITPTVSSAGVVTLPTGFGGWKRFTARDGTNEWDLELVSAEAKPEIMAIYGSSGMPRALVTIGATSQIWPYTDGAYTFAGLHFTRIPALTASATTNWVVTNFPNAYLYGCMAAACRMGIGGADVAMIPKLQAQEATYSRLFDRMIAGIQREDAIDLDARTHATLEPDTTLFGRSSHNITTDS